MYHTSSGQNPISFTLWGKSRSEKSSFPKAFSFWNKAFGVVFFILLAGAVKAQGQASPKPKEMTTVHRLELQVKNNPKSLKAIKNLAQEYFTQGDIDNCTRLLWKSIDSLDRSSMILLAKAHLKKKEHAETIRVAQILISKDEKDEEAHTLMGQAHFQAGREKDALTSFKRATEINGIYQPAYEGLISIYQKRDNLYELRILYQDMIEKLGSKPEYLTRLCDINTRDSLNDHALEFCRKAIQKADQVPENHVNLALVYKNQDELPKAQQMLKSTAERFPRSIYAQVTYAKFMAEKSDFIEAFRYYSNCLKIEPENEACLLGHGLSGPQIQKFEESLQSLKKACFKDRKHAVTVRKVIQLLKASKNKEWQQKFESLSDKCMLQ